MAALDPGGIEVRSGRTLVVVLGRTQYWRPSGLVDSLIADLEAAGHTVRRFRPTEQWLDEQFATSGLADFCLRHPRAAGSVRRLTKLGFLIRQPSRWDYLVTLVDRRSGPPTSDRESVRFPRSDRRRLRSMIRNADAGRVCLLAHSAGGIVATMTASEPLVTSVVCFGYPFKHPGRPYESYRTAHLPSVAKPFLIVQGDGDEYGSPQDARRYPLSPSTIVMGVNTGHDYSDLDPGEYRVCRDLVLRIAVASP